MAITGVGALIHGAIQCRKDPKASEKKDRPVDTEKWLTGGTAQVLNGLDTLVGITAVVLGILALLNILPMGEWFAAGAIGFGAAEILASVRQSYQSIKANMPESCKCPCGKGGEEEVPRRS